MFSFVSHHFYDVWHHSLQHVVDEKLDFILWPESVTWLLFTGNSFSSNKKNPREKECQSVLWLSELSTNFTWDGMMLS